MRKQCLIFAIGFLANLGILSQTSFPYTPELIPMELPGFAGLHSFAWAQHEGKWLILGGRKDGMHARQPFKSFPGEENNTDIYVIDIETKESWSTEVATLPINIREQMQSTNMNFFQDSDTLYFLGGYAYAASVDDHITFPYLTSIDVPGLIDAVRLGKAIIPFFKQIENDVFAVSGGHLEKLNDRFFLVGGHRFDGRYNPMGNPTYMQEYTNQIRKFRINNSGDQLSFSDYSAQTDEIHLRRRDYNLLPQIFPNGEEGFTISSGVFQSEVDLPFLYPVDILDSSYTPVTGFNQYLSHYHSAVSLMYDSDLNEMHSIFFGGMSQYYYQDGLLVQDSLVPFVQTISRLSRDGEGMLEEHKLDLEMPFLHGASAEFIPNENMPHIFSEILDLSAVEKDTFTIGHIVGGLFSPSLNPFSYNLTGTTSASSTIYEVRLSKEQVSNWVQLPSLDMPLDIEVFPNPNSGHFTIGLELRKQGELRYFLSDLSGRILYRSPSLNAFPGNNHFNVRITDLQDQMLMLTVVLDGKQYWVQKVSIM